MDKIELRKQLKAQRNALSREQVELSSKLVCEHILASDTYRQAEKILGYLAFGKELLVDTVLRKALEDGKQVYVPHIISNTEFVLAELKSFENLALDRYGIRCVKEPFELGIAEQLDLVLVPAVAFAKDGNRMGMGAGYYDRFLLKCPQAKLFGIAYAALLQEALPKDQYDVAVPYLVTEGGIVKTIC
ncbi:MAG: 5-formyltetrahydrofolate cyclo-ligase [Phascolarctobacterium sp.]|nr:5-formyltetrahydrofolate cyclo-ligase [Phascolarctobacterium sp.]